MNCLVCGTPLKNMENDCHRCGFHYLNSVGGSFEENFNLQKDIADYYRDNTFLPRFELAVNCYHWKDEAGKYALASKELLSFGTAADLRKDTVWLKQEFARLPEEQTLVVEILVREQNAPERTIRFPLPMIREPELQRLGLCLEESWHMEDGRRVADSPVLKLKLKTASGSREVESAPVKLIAD